MPFWQALVHFGDSVALFDGGDVFSYADLRRAADVVSDHLHSADKKLCYLPITRSIAAVAAYLGLLRSDHAVLLASPAADVGSAIGRFQCDVVLWPCGTSMPCALAGYRHTGILPGFNIYETCSAPKGPPIEAELCLLLATSGSTGGARFARLSRNNLAIAASQVCHALDITSRDRAITSLPLHHVYGLSVLHGQLQAGAAVVLSDRSVMDRHFWEICRADEVSMLAGVPWTFVSLRQAGFDPCDFPRLLKVTQSGERPDPSTLDWLLHHFAVLPRQLYLMYGQTETTGRICVLPPAIARQKPRSVGLPVRGGRIECSPDGEIVYHGPNVMLGYAADRNDLARADDLVGSVHTGDIGIIDGEGCLHLSGRRARFCKLFGERINLDDVEVQFQEFGRAVVIGCDSQLTVYIENSAPERVRQRANWLADRLHIPRRSITVLPVKSLPILETGKVSLAALATMTAVRSAGNQSDLGELSNGT